MTSVNREFKRYHYAVGSCNQLQKKRVALLRWSIEQRIGRLARC
ncbi:hypothetical protein E6C60_0254 [Paenibacillus algicola]|uniref:Uncharacterized protein n=1 Tax=Paenibacillus algicola TaxID=2565926 RepID=A0A4P8XHR5_9BACL|nr:hypothetical protein E6C60_0254 [Paenibacillus algicola]